MGKAIKPSFQKNFPKDAKKYFSIESDFEFKAEHPVGYHIMQWVGITASAIPIVLYLFFILYVFHIPNSGWILLGFGGCVHIWNRAV